MTIYVTDSFTDTDGTALHSHTPDVGTSFVDASGSGALTIQSNCIPGESFANDRGYYTNSPPASADYEASITVSLGLLMRGTPAVLVRGERQSWHRRL